ncbi:hypothetical protein HMPREF9997_02684 [Corynebacterium durum F0235]|uniref:Uncharacterized protein n=1 Tax=Corynebacterium durum F0235 TaxID=1035195 RepID=L1M7Z9_9CORY|nr:hypothetical protein HMPREF9997_02684 [Corynebacterium durum F0235]
MRGEWAVRAATDTRAYRRPVVVADRFPWLQASSINYVRKS